jgi:hypothetical protein
MEENLNIEERSVLKLISYFQKRKQQLEETNQLDDSLSQLLETCDKLATQLHVHADNRAVIIAGRNELQNMIKDNAKCPHCHSAANLKLIGTERNEKNWSSNKYKCRACNITFVWNAPNNPWDMIPYVEHFISDLEVKLADSDIDEENRSATQRAIEQMRESIKALKPVVEASDRQMQELKERDEQMADIVSKIKKHLMIQKIRLED